MAQDDKKDYQLLATEENAPPPAYEAASSSSTSDVPDTQHALLRAQPVRALHVKLLAVPQLTDSVDSRRPPCRG